MVAKSKKMLLIAMLVVIAMLFTACAGGSSNEGSGNNQSESNGSSPSNTPSEQQPEEQDEPAELFVYSNSGDSVESWNERFGDTLKEAFPHYTITYLPKEKDRGLNELILSGQRIDIYWDSIAGFINTLKSNSLQFDMTDLINKHDIDLAGMEPTIVEAINNLSDGGYFGVPVFNNTLVMYYNKDLFDKFGVDYPTDGMTWKEASDLGRQLTRTEDGIMYAGLSTSETHMLQMNQLSIPYVDEETFMPTIGTDPRWIEWMNEVFIEPANAPGYKEYMVEHANKLPYRLEFLEAQDLAMFGWLASIIFVFPEEYGNMNWDMVSMPTMESRPGIGPQAYPTYFGVTSMAENRDAAAKVIKHLTSKEVQTNLSRIGLMPVLNDEEVIKQYGEGSVFQGKNFRAAFYNEFAPIPFKSEFDRSLTVPYAKTIPRVILEGDYNTIFRETQEEREQAIQAALKERG